MDRRAVVRAALSAGIIAAAGIALATCSNPINIQDAVTTEVMVANNKFLIVDQTGPFIPNQTNVSPGTPVWVKFDRDLDEASVGTTAVVFSPAATWTWTYNPSTRTLTVQPGFLEGN